MTFPPIGGLDSGMTRRRYALLAEEDRDLIERLRRDTALPVAAIATLLCTTETAVHRICRERDVVCRYTLTPYRRRTKRQPAA
jgi:hypothetical protein